MTQANFMRLRFLLSSLALFFLASPLHTQSPPPTQNPKQLVAEGKRAYMNRDFSTAREKFQKLLEIEPGNTFGLQYLRAMEIVEEKSGTGTPLAQQLKNLTIPKVEFRDATFRDALDALAGRHREEEPRIKISFVLQIPEETQRKPVTLSLSNVPFLEVLRYLCDATGTQYVVETHAVVIKPTGAAAVSSSPAAASANATP